MIVDTLSKPLGALLGVVSAPLFGLTSTLRRARTFHAGGDCAEGIALISPDAAILHEALAARLSGPVLVRFSDALTKRKARWPDVLGCALRFGGHDGDQDLLFATIKRPWTMPFSPLTTHVEDYFANDYFAVSPFSVEELDRGRGRTYFRLRSDVTSVRDSNSLHARGPENRRALLERRVIDGLATLTLGIATGPWGPFCPVLQIRLTNVWDDEPELRFDPFRAARGITPIGFVHALRRSVYAMSQLAREH